MPNKLVPHILQCLLLCLSCCYALPTYAQQQEPATAQERASAIWQSLQQQEAAVDSFEQIMDNAYDKGDTLLMQELLLRTKASHSSSPLWKITYHFWTGLYFMRIADYSNAAKAFGEAVDHSEKHQIDRFLLRAGMNQAICLRRSNQVKEAYALYSKLEQVILDKKQRVHKDTIYLFNIKYNLAYQAYIEDDFVQALLGFQEAFRVAQMAKDTSGMSRVLYNIIGMQAFIGEEEDSKASRELLLSLLDARVTDYNTTEALGVRLEAATSIAEADSCFQELEKMQQAGKIDNPLSYLYSYATWLEEHVSFTAAFPVNQRIINIYNTNCNQNPIYYYTRISMIRHYLEQAAYKQVVREAHEVLNCIRTLEDQEAEQSLFEKLSTAHAALQHSDSAYLYLRQSTMLRDSMEARKGTEKIMKAYLQNQFKQEKQRLATERQNEKAAAKALLARQRTLLLGSIIIIGLILGLLLTLYRNYQIKAESARKLSRYSKKLEQSNQKLERFAGSISHDILSNLDLLLSVGNILVEPDKNPASLRQYYDQSKQTLSSMKDYCLKLLESARKSTDKQVQTTDTNVVLHQALSNNNLILEAQQVKVSSSPLPPFPVEEGDLLQIFQNLLSNAIAFAGMQPDGQIVVQSLTTDEEVCIGVLDNGPGIPEDQLESIFEQGVSFKQGGNGHGLIIVRDIVESYGGRVWAERSELGGAGVWFSVSA